MNSNAGKVNIYLHTIKLLDLLPLDNSHSIKQYLLAIGTSHSINLYPKASFLSISLS